MAALLAKFRIPFNDVILLPEATKKPSKATRDEFSALMSSSSLDVENTMGAYEEKTNFHLRLAEMVRQNSSQAELVCMTLPLPTRRSSPVPAPLYMAWLDLITKDMPPFFLVRGNQDSVLTFYS